MAYGKVRPIPVSGVGYRVSADTCQYWWVSVFEYRRRYQ